MSSTSGNPSPDHTAPPVARIPSAITCVHCEQPLDCSRLNGDCPACRKPVADTLDPDAIDLDTATVSANIPCPQCGYNLRTLGIGSVCPECNHAVSLALRPPPLSLTDPVWRKRVRRGICWLLFFLVVSQVSFLAYMIPVLMGFTPPGFVEIMVGPWSQSIVLVTMAMGIFAVSARDGHGFNQHASAWPRRVARAAILLSIFFFAVAMGAVYLVMSGRSPDLGRTVTNVTVFLSSNLSSAGLIAAGFCLRQIARGAREQSFIKWTNVWLAITLLLISVSLLPYIVECLAPASMASSPDIERLQMAVEGILPYAGFIPWILAIVGLLAYHRLLRRAEAAAQKRHTPN